jgi:indolepyruvate ferredoxin oxidoreductase beta subunit
VPGVAQRTGATVYYIETLPLPADAPQGLRPVLSLMAVPGEIDIVIGTEFMEAGRAIQRGLVTPDRTTLIASTHRAYAVVEKQVPGDGIGDTAAVLAAAEAAAKRLVAFDIAAAAEESGSAVSAVTFGAIAGADVLPFSRDSYEATIRAAGVGVEASLRGFALGYERVKTPVETSATTITTPPTAAPPSGKAFAALSARAQSDFPAQAQEMVTAGLRRVVDFQDLAYGKEYLGLLDDILKFDNASKGYALTTAAAKYLAVAMAYDDVYRVADLKTRASRFTRVRAEIGVNDDQLVYTTEFMHPRMDEVAGSLPAQLGRFIENRPGLMQALDRVVNRGRRVRTTSLRWFLALYVLGGMKRFRRGTLRHANEAAHRDAWLARAKAVAGRDYELAVEILNNRRLVKGYSDTHARGLSKFDRVMMAAAKLEGRQDAAEWVRRLREAALKDEEGVALDGALKTVDSFLH